MSLLWVRVLFEQHYGQGGTRFPRAHIAMLKKWVNLKIEERGIP